MLGARRGEDAPASRRELSPPLEIIVRDELATRPKPAPGGGPVAPPGDLLAPANAPLEEPNSTRPSSASASAAGGASQAGAACTTPRRSGSSVSWRDIRGVNALCHAGVFVAALGCYVWDDLSRAPSPAEEFAWTTLCCFALLGLPGLFLHLAGYAFFPIVWGERFPEREKALEELGGKLYFRFVRLKSDPPVATKRAVDVAAEVLSRTIPNKLWEIELVSEDDLFVGAANVRELAYPRDRARGGEWSSKRRGCFSSFSLARRSAEEDLDRDPGPSRCDLLEYAVEASGAGWGDWVVHMGADSVLNQRAVDAIAFHAARESRLVALSSASNPRGRRIARGSTYPGLTRTANALEGGVPGVLGWVPAAAEVLRAGEAHGAARVGASRQSAAAISGDASFLVVPNEFERAVGFRADSSPPGMELASFALRCGERGALFAWLDAGVHAPVTRGWLALFASRTREYAGRWTLATGADVPLAFGTQANIFWRTWSDAFAKLAPALCVASPFVQHAPTNEGFAVACGLGLAAALVTFQYAVGFYASAGPKHLAKGAAGYALYHLLFVLTLALVPVFSLFELVAMLVAACVAPRFGRGRREGGEGRGYGGPRGRRVRLGRGSVHSDDHLVGSDGEVRRGRNKSGGGGSRVFQRSEAAEADRSPAASDAARRTRGARASGPTERRREGGGEGGRGFRRRRGGVGVEIERRGGIGERARRRAPAETGARSARAPGGVQRSMARGLAAPIKSGRGGDDGDEETRTRETSTFGRRKRRDGANGPPGYISHRIVVCDEKRTTLRRFRPRAGTSRARDC